MSDVAVSASTNRLGRALSPYLLQHAHQPVHWQEWGPEALDQARREDKPIFLSVGYAACHWCHVMAHESFDDRVVADFMNAHFVNVKVDREERPDIDEIYMRATMVLNQGQGGWPMSVWLTPDLEPFFAGTYFPPAPRWGRPSFRELCQRIAEAWGEHRDRIAQHAATLTAVVRESLTATRDPAPPLSLELVDATVRGLADAFDPQSGGLFNGGTNKFPPSMALDLMMRAIARRPVDDPQRQTLLEHVQRTLDHMAAGGIYDQLAGGFHRYSTDVEWHVPHFEKMLYDQALVSRAYLDAYQLTGRGLYARVARETCAYVLGDLGSPVGGFCSARDADSDGQEGRYYVWTREEVLAVLGPECGAKFSACFDISESGNWSDPHDPGTPKSVPRLLRDAECCARMYSISTEEFYRRVGNGREKLLAARARRVPPALDDKILCEWNGLMISSLARAGCVLSEPRFVEQAARAADFLLGQRDRDGRLRRCWRDGRSQGVAFLADYAALTGGLIDLYEATFERRWLEAAEELTGITVDRFWDHDDGGFFFTAAHHEPLLARSKDVSDAAVPCGNSLELMNLLRLAAMLGRPELEQLAKRQMAAFAASVRQSPSSAECFLAGVELAACAPTEVVIVGPLRDDATQALLRTVYSTYLPNRVLLLHDPQRPDDSVPSPLLAGRELVDGRPAGYVCHRGICARPATDSEELARVLRSVGGTTQAWGGGRTPG